MSQIVRFPVMVYMKTISSILETMRPVVSIATQTKFAWSIKTSLCFLILWRPLHTLKHAAIIRHTALCVICPMTIETIPLLLRYMIIVHINTARKNEESSQSVKPRTCVFILSHLVAHPFFGNSTGFLQWNDNAQQKLFVFFEKALEIISCIRG